MVIFNVRVMRVLFLIVALLVGCFPYAFGGDSFAGSHKEKLAVLDTSRLECIYEHYEYDEGVDRGDCREEILQLGQNYLVYMFYAAYRTDSVIQAMDDKEREMMSFQHYNRIAVKYGWCGSDRLRLDLKSRDVRSLKGSLLVQETLPVQQWKMLPDEKVVMGYKCKKATCSFRGRDWTAWYCPEIKIPYGPWKLNGLPGLILVAEDEAKAHRYVAIGLRTQPMKIFDNRFFTSGKLIDRKQFYRNEKDHCYNFCKGMWDAYNEDPVNNERPAVERLMFVPLELDF